MARLARQKSRKGLRLELKTNGVHPVHAYSFLLKESVLSKVLMLMFCISIGNREKASPYRKAVIGEIPFRLTGNQCLSDVSKAAILAGLRRVALRWRRRQ